MSLLYFVVNKCFIASYTCGYFYLFVVMDIILIHYLKAVKCTWLIGKRDSTIQVKWNLRMRKAQ